jgi:hypothetical protein
MKSPSRYSIEKYMCLGEFDNIRCYNKKHIEDNDWFP